MAPLLSHLRRLVPFARSQRPAKVDVHLQEHATGPGDEDRRIRDSVDLNATLVAGRSQIGGSIAEVLGKSGANWWGHYEVPIDGWRLFELGQMRVWAGRFAGEWRFATEPNPAGKTEGWETKVVEAGPEWFARYAVTDEQNKLLLAPILPERPLVFRPRVPLYLPENQELTVYVEIPLWVAFCSVDPLREVASFPLQVLSDTWFGPTTREGELCYACKTPLAIGFRYRELSSFRATCAISLANRGPTPLKLERIRVRVEALALFQENNGRIWTQDVIFDRTRGNDPIAMQIRPGPPSAAKNATQIAGPRSSESANLVLKALSHLF
jgi:hypothetical protein